MKVRKRHEEDHYDFSTGVQGKIRSEGLTAQIFACSRSSDKPAQRGPSIGKRRTITVGGVVPKVITQSAAAAQNARAP